MEDMIRPSQNMGAIPMLDLKAQYVPIKEEIKSAVKDIIESGRFILGENVESFENEMARYHNLSHAVGLASGTDALHLSLKALGITSGDEVITTPFTFIASAEVIAYVGATPVFVDIDSKTLNIDVSKIEEKINEKTKAIIVVHLFGLPADMTVIMKLAEKYNLKIIEDCAQSIGASYKGAHVGSLGDCGCYSFYPSKNLGAYGDGGMMVTDSIELHDRVKLLRNHGTVGPYQHDFIGFNSRLDEIHAAILRIKLRLIDQYNQNRQNIAKLYTSLLGNLLQCPAELDDRTHVYHQYTIRTPLRDKIHDALKTKSIASVVYYPLPLHLQGAFRDLGYKLGDLPESEAASDEVLSIPIYPELEPEKAEYIARTIVEVVNS